MQLTLKDRAFELKFHEGEWWVGLTDVVQNGCKRGYLPELWIRAAEIPGAKMYAANGMEIDLVSKATQSYLPHLPDLDVEVLKWFRETFLPKLAAHAKRENPNGQA
jgi:hypothetical protein